MSNLPAFMIIGAMKSATSTLQYQLTRQPGIGMCTPKEPNFFSDDDQYSKGIEWYEELFSGFPEDFLTGEASTHYTKLPTYPKTVERIAEYSRDLKFIYVMRHPIDRLISHYMHEWSMGVYKCNINEAVSRHPEMIAYSQYAFQLEPFLNTFGKENVLPIFFDRLIKQPQSELERICRFIGYQGGPVWEQSSSPRNVSSKRIRKFPFYNYLVESGLATSIRRTFIPQSFRSYVKSKLRMEKKPELSVEVLSKLESLFDEDLKVLSCQLGTSINCQNFRHITADKPLNWTSIND